MMMEIYFINVSSGLLTKVQVPEDLSKEEFEKHLQDKRRSKNS